TLANGWALRNFPTAVTNNPHYGVCDIVFVDFGLNDIPTAGSQLNETIEQTNLLIDEIEKTGALPVLLTSGPAYLSDSSGRGKNELLLEINTIKKDLAAQRGIPLIDKAAMLQDWLAHNCDEARWINAEPDALHFGDIGHQAQASIIAAELYGGIVNIEDDVQYLSILDNRVNSVFGLSEIYKTATSKFPNFLMSMADVNKYTGKRILTVWLRVRSASAGLAYYAVRNEGIETQNGMVTELIDISKNTVITQAYSPNQGFKAPALALETGSSPISLGQVTYGLQKLTVYFPKETSTDASIFWGFLSVNPNWKPLFTTIQQTRNLPRVVHYANNPKSEKMLFVKPLLDDGSNYWGLGFGYSRSTLYFKASLTQMAGLGLMLVNGADAKPALVDRCFSMFRNNKNGLSIMVLHRNASGVSGFESTELMNCGTLVDDDEHEYKFVLERNSEGASLKFYQGYASTTPLTEVTAKEGEVFPFPMGGAFGSTWSYKGNTSVKVSEAFVLEEKL
ncbi:SGNH/GDSL hydrolase family protein, partial [Providencia rettgeri]